MPIWQLLPLNATDPNWAASNYRGKVIVRARNEETARKEAEKAFGMKTRFPPGAGITAPPWKRPALVSAEVVEEPLYEPEGPTEILFPPGE
jgi:hypothetical protein